MLFFLFLYTYDTILSDLLLIVVVKIYIRNDVYNYLYYVQQLIIAENG